MHVTNNTINIDQYNLGVIREPSEKLFAFTSAEIELNIQGIESDARFLFTSLAKLTLAVGKKRVYTIVGETILRKVTIFEEVSSLKNKLIVEIKIRTPETRIIYPKWKRARVTLDDKIGIARERLDALSINLMDKPIKKLFMRNLKKDCLTDKLVCWPRLIELNMYRCNVETLNNPFFEMLVPNLRKLNLGQNRIESLEADAFKYAGKLLELDLHLSEIKNSLLSSEKFNGLLNLRVLNVNLKSLDSLEFLSCLFNLEELVINVDNTFPLKRLDAIPKQLSKLRTLKLNFKCDIERIAPTTFDHLTCLERFEFKRDNCSSKNGLTQNPLEIGVAPRFLKVVGIDTLRLRSCESSVANIETIELCEDQHELKLTKLECDWPLSGLKRLSAIPLNENSLSYNQMLNLEFLSLNLTDFGLLSRSGLDCLFNLTELRVGYNYLS
jgi:hypothetical protein